MVDAQSPKFAITEEMGNFQATVISGSTMVFVNGMFVSVRRESRRKFRDSLRGLKIVLNGDTFAGVIDFVMSSDISRDKARDGVYN
jgi:hypothetical protein